MRMVDPVTSEAAFIAAAEMDSHTAVGASLNAVIN
jgi:hypothetical protein